MRTPRLNLANVRKPIFLSESMHLASYLQSLDVSDISRIMKIKPDLAERTKRLIESWDSNSKYQTVAIDTFLGDIYSGLQASTLDDSDREFADKSLVILSGLYGMIRPLDGIMPYRLEMGYKLAGFETPNLYKYWGDKIALQIPKDEIILNLSSVEYSRVVTDFVNDNRIITPKFLTINPKTKQPTFVVVHAKIARGAYAHWAIKQRLIDVKEIKIFDELGYKYNPALSTPHDPVFVCEQFGGLGLSVRLTSG